MGIADRLRRAERRLEQRGLLAAPHAIPTLADFYSDKRSEILRNSEHFPQLEHFYPPEAAAWCVEELARRYGRAAP